MTVTEQDQLHLLREYQKLLFIMQEAIEHLQKLEKSPGLSADLLAAFEQMAVSHTVLERLFGSEKFADELELFHTIVLKLNDNQMNIAEIHDQFQLFSYNIHNKIASMLVH